MKLARALMVMSLLLFAMSLCFSCYHLEGDTQDWSFFSDTAPGYLLLMIGWLGLLCWEPAWLANPLWLFAVVALFTTTLQKNESRVGIGVWLGMLSAVCGLAMALTFALQTSTHCGRGGEVLTPIGGLGPGYFLWIASMTALIMSALVLAFQTLRRVAGKSSQL